MMMRLLVHGLGAWFAVEAASGRYPRPIAVGLTMLVTRLGAPATALAMAGYGLKRLREARRVRWLAGTEAGDPPLVAKAGNPAWPGSLGARRLKRLDGAT